MFKKIIVFALFLFLVACDQTTQTTVTTEANTSQSTNILSTDTASMPTFNLELTRVGNIISSSTVANASAYVFYIEDYKYTLGNLTSDVIRYVVETETASIDLSDYPINNTYKIQAACVVDSVETNRSQVKYYEYYTNLGTIAIDYNINNLNDLYIEELNTYQVVYYDSEITTTRSYETREGMTYLPKGFLVGYGTEVELKAYTLSGVYTINITFKDITKPYIISANEVTFAGEDLSFIFDLCAGEFVDINGSLLSSDDYTLVNGILTIESEFFQALFDDEPERDTVILGYQLRNDTDIVIGYLFIRRSDTN